MLSLILLCLQTRYAYVTRPPVRQPGDSMSSHTPDSREGEPRGGVTESVHVSRGLPGQAPRVTETRTDGKPPRPAAQGKDIDEDCTNTFYKKDNRDLC